MAKKVKKIKIKERFLPNGQVIRFEGEEPLIKPSDVVKKWSEVKKAIKNTTSFMKIMDDDKEAKNKTKDDGNSEELDMTNELPVSENETQQDSPEISQMDEEEQRKILKEKGFSDEEIEYIITGDENIINKLYEQEDSPDEEEVEGPGSLDEESPIVDEKQPDSQELTDHDNRRKEEEHKARLKMMHDYVEHHRDMIEKILGYDNETGEENMKSLKKNRASNVVITEKEANEKVGKTQSGKSVYSTPKHESYKNFTDEDHADAAALHHDKASKCMSKKDLRGWHHHVDVALKHIDKIKKN